MSDDPEPLECQRCHRPVVRERANYETLEHMHWSCFHYEFEHAGDPDIACGDPRCPARAFDPTPPPSWLEVRNDLPRD